MADLSGLRLVFQEAVAAVASEFDQPIPLDHLLDAVTEEPAQVANFLGKSFACGELIRTLWEHQGMTAAHADVLMNAVTIRQTDIRVMTQEAGERMPHMGSRAVLLEICLTTPAMAGLLVSVGKHLVIDDMTPKGAAQAHTVAPHRVRRKRRPPGLRSDPGLTPV
ncbi:MAG: hypothetical protein WBC51_03950 [Vicinamibacterales bacterium]